MAEIKDVIYYFLKNYPYKDELSKTRFTKMVYLADWQSVQKHGKQITKIKWFFDHYGPYVPDVYEAARKDKRLNIERGFSAFGSPKETIAFHDDYKDYPDNKIKLNDGEKGILNEVIENTKYLSWSDFIGYVYSTDPISTQTRYENLDLVKINNDNR